MKKQIKVEKRHGDFKAFVGHYPPSWGAGRTESEAIGEVIKNHPEDFNIVISESNEKTMPKLYLYKAILNGISESNKNNETILLGYFESFTDAERGFKDEVEARWAEHWALYYVTDLMSQEKELQAGKVVCLY